MRTCNQAIMILIEAWEPLKICFCKQALEQWLPTRGKNRYFKGLGEPIWHVSLYSAEQILCFKKDWFLM